MKKILLILICLPLLFSCTETKKNQIKTSSSKKDRPTKTLLIKTLYDFAYQINKEDYDAAANFYVDDNDFDMQKLKFDGEINQDMTFQEILVSYLKNGGDYKGMRFQKYINEADENWKFGKVIDIGENKHKNYIKYIINKENCYMMCDSIYQGKEIIALWKDGKFKFLRIDE